MFLERDKFSRRLSIAAGRVKVSIDWQNKCEGATLANTRGGGCDCPTSRFHYLLNNGQAKTNAGTVYRGSALKLSKAREKFFHIFSSDTVTCVGDFNRERRVFGDIIKFSIDIDTAFACELKSILDQIHQDLFESTLVPKNGWDHL